MISGVSPLGVAYTLFAASVLLIPEVGYAAGWLVGFCRADLRARCAGARRVVRSLDTACHRACRLIILVFRVPSIEHEEAALRLALSHSTGAGQTLRRWRASNPEWGDWVFGVIATAWGASAWLDHDQDRGNGFAALIFLCGWWPVLVLGELRPHRFAPRPIRLIVATWRIRRSLWKMTVGGSIPSMTGTTAQ